LSLDGIIGSGTYSKICKIASEPLVKLTLCSNNEQNL